MKIIKTILLILALAYSSLACNDTITVKGQVFNHFNVPVYQARVETDTYFGYTNPLGWFSFDIPNCGKRTFKVTKKGLSFQTQTVIFPVPDTKDSYELEDFVAD